ncbi:MAG: hypothetical protein A4E48_02353 [Methanosaeta sp. PtaU1.Bin060]|jgi:hypothetical protein|nr:MAG: hypothetical protein A4E44_02174 [Methanosaeta sp. PtaB.Bin018]OPY49220.1 MAG: hypothetical protein A4E48_02353 [Methanosaeta sp. PtaU1.Bin060]
MKIRSVNGSRYLGVPKELVKKLRSDYMTVRVDDAGRLIYTPLQEVA